LRTYLENLTGISTHPDNHRKIIGTMGLTELDLNVFMESPYTVAIRKQAQQDTLFRTALLGADVPAVPELFHYFPHRTFLETTAVDGQPGELLFSMLSPDLSMPLIRYNSKDWGQLFSYLTILNTLQANQLNHLAPDLKLPLVAVGGRKNRVIMHRGIAIPPEHIKQSIYENETCARSTTGYFRLKERDHAVTIDLQLNDNVQPTTQLQSLYEQHIHTYLDAEIAVRLFPYSDYPYNMDLNYEQKFKFI
jgi:phenylacetate-CoA ligase